MGEDSQIRLENLRKEIPGTGSKNKWGNCDIIIHILLVYAMV